MSEALIYYLADAASFVAPSGGFFYWLSLPEVMDTSDLLASALEYKVGFQPGIKFSSSQNFCNYLRMSFAFYHEDEIRNGIERMGNAVAGSMDKQRLR